MTLDDLDKKFNELAAKLEKRFEEFRTKIEDHLSHPQPATEEKTEKQPELRRYREVSFWGVVLVIVGVILLGNHFNWFDVEIPIIPTAFIILGCYLILEHRPNR